MTLYPEPVEQIRHVEPVQPARGGTITRVTVRLNTGRAVTFYEVAANGSVTVCEDRRAAFEACREMRRV